MVTLAWEFHLTNVPSSELASASPDSSQAAAYMLTRLALLMAITAAIAPRYAKLAAATWPRRRLASAGLATTAAGILVALAYAVSRSGAIVAHLTGHPWPSAVETHVLPTAGALAMLFATLGLTLPTIGHRAVLPLRQSVKRRKITKDDALRQAVRL
jgi:hypothetical protein